jgi:hypothetical protein
MTREIVFCALVRDCLRRLKRNSVAFKNLQRTFPQARWVFVENDSKDGTRAWLEEWAGRDSRVTILGADTGEDTIPRSDPRSPLIPGYSLHRIERMASFRNLYIEWIERNLRQELTGVMVAIDPDVRSFPVTRMVHWIRNLPPDKAITALGLRWSGMKSMQFHDAYAFRDGGDMETQTLAAIQQRRLTLATKLKGSPPMAVRSNFNGLGIYPINAIRGCRYECLKNADPQVQAECEHVPFHDQLAARGVEVMIDPQMKIIYNGWLAVTTGAHRARIKRFFLRARL